MRSVLTLILLSWLSVSAATVGDATIADLLAGQWIGETPQGSSTSIYFEDGRFVVDAIVMKDEPVPLSIRVEGQWQLKGRILTLEITRTTDALLAPIGVVSRDTVLCIDSGVAVFQRSTGETYLRTKVAKDNKLALRSPIGC
jgi:hypothetical protein